MTCPFAPISSISTSDRSPACRSISPARAIRSFCRRSRGQIIRVFRLKLSFQAATTILIKDGANILDGPLFFLANGGMVLDNTGIPWYTRRGIS